MRRRFRQPTMTEQAFITKKIEILRHEGYPEDQAIAIAYSMAKVDSIHRKIKKKRKRR